MCPDTNIWTPVVGLPVKIIEQSELFSGCDSVNMMLRMLLPQDELSGLLSNM